MSFKLGKFFAVLCVLAVAVSAFGWDDDNCQDAATQGCLGPISTELERAKPCPPDNVQQDMEQSQVTRPVVVNKHYHYTTNGLTKAQLDAVLKANNQKVVNQANRHTDKVVGNLEQQLGNKVDGWGNQLSTQLTSGFDHTNDHIERSGTTTVLGLLAVFGGLAAIIFLKWGRQS